jgi:sigma-B regulation protein RsbU (phosphoserine phosphatase)
VTQLSPRRSFVVLRRISPRDRIAIAFIAAYAILRVVLIPHPFPLSGFLGFLSVVAFVYICFRLFFWVRRKLLWRLRNRLIVAYIFIAVVPVVLLLTMMAIGMYLLYPQIGAHLLQDGLQDRIGIIAADASEIAEAVTQEVRPGESPTDPALLSRPSVANLIAAFTAEWPGLRVSLHSDRVVNLSSGDRFAGLTELRGQLSFAAEQRVQSPAGPVVVLVSAHMTPGLLDSLTSELGPIQFTLMDPADESSKGIRFGVDGRFYVVGERVVSNNRSLPPAASWYDIPVGGAATLQAYRIDTDPGPHPVRRSVAVPVLTTFSLRPSTLNKTLFSSVGAVGPILLDIVIACAIVFLLLEAAALVTGTILTRTITRSVADLYDGTLHVARGDFTHRVRVRTRDQLGALGDSFNEMTGSIANLVEEQRQRQRLEHEIAIASEVQQQLFPKCLPVLPGLHLAALCRPARVVSGDYYDFIRLGPTSVGIAVADISGKGIFAALLMASLQAALRSRAALDGNGETSKLVAQLNDHLFKNTSDDRYATLFYATYDSETHTLTYTNAGHLAPFLITNGHVQHLEQGGTVIGLLENPAFTQVTLPVSPGTILVAFSDGVTETVNAYGEEFGTERLEEEILLHRDLDADSLMQAVLKAVERWAGQNEQADDVTIVVARMD